MTRLWKRRKNTGNGYTMENFKQLVKKLNPRYKMPGRKYFSVLWQYCAAPEELQGSVDLVIVKLKCCTVISYFYFKFQEKTLTYASFVLTVDSYHVPGYNSVLLLLHCNAASAAGTYFSRFALNIGSVISDSSCGNANWHQAVDALTGFGDLQLKLLTVFVVLLEHFKAFTANNLVH